MNIKKHIPNAITCGNLICGSLAIVQVFQGNLVWAACLVGIALVLDFFDGFTARMLKVASPIGKDLDSLADMVTFGVVPGMVMYRLISNWTNFFVGVTTDQPNDIGGKPNFSFEFSGVNMEAFFCSPYLKYAGLIIIVFSAIRLAKFNNDTRQSDSFIGLPTPANAMIICSIPLIGMQLNESVSQIPNQFQTEDPGNIYAYADLSPVGPHWLVLGSIVLSFLLVAEIPLFALKFKNFSWADNKLVYCFLIVSVALFVSLKFVAIPLVILLYILASIVNNIFLKKKV